MWKPNIASATVCLALLSVSLMQGCAVNETATVTEKQDGDYAQLIESNSGLFSADLSIVDVKMGRAGDLLRVQASLKNGSRNDLSFRYKFKWLDDDGFELELDGRPWNPITITPYETKQIQAVAPNNRASAFKVMVQD